MRKRITWKNGKRNASSTREASRRRLAAEGSSVDIYNVNNPSHINPDADAYMFQDRPWEDVVNTEMRHIYDGYDGEFEARDEVGLPRMKPETFSGYGATKGWGVSKGYDNQKLAVARGRSAVIKRVAARMADPSDTQKYRRVVASLKRLPDEKLISLYTNKEASVKKENDKDAYKKALVATKLAAITAPNASSASIKRLATLFNSMPDDELKSMAKVVVEGKKKSNRVASLDSNDLDAIKDIVKSAILESEALSKVEAMPVEEPIELPEEPVIEEEVPEEPVIEEAPVETPEEEAMETPEEEAAEAAAGIEEEVPENLEEIFAEEPVAKQSSTKMNARGISRKASGVKKLGSVKIGKDMSEEDIVAALLGK